MSKITNDFEEEDATETTVVPSLEETNSPVAQESPPAAKRVRNKGTPVRQHPTGATHVVVSRPSRKEPHNIAAPKRRWRPGTVALREIRHQQKSTNFVIPRIPFKRLVREIVGEKQLQIGTRMRAEAVEALQTEAEAFLVWIFKRAMDDCASRGMVTLMEQNMLRCLEEYAAHRETFLIDRSHFEKFFRLMKAKAEYRQEQRTRALA